MGKKEEFVLTIEQCQRLAETASICRVNFPKKWGEKPVPDDEQLIGREDLAELWKTLRSYSSWMQGIGEDYKLLFGDKEDWYPIDKNDKKLEKVAINDPAITGWKFTNPKKPYTIRLTRDALSGAVWCCNLRLHPQTPMPINTKEAVEVWWPLAEVIGKVIAVKKYIGLAGAKRTEWEDDPEPTETKQEEEKK